MNKYIQQLVEAYYDSTEQMNRILKDAAALRKAEEKAKENRIEFIVGVLGKQTYNKFANKGLFAPVPLSAMKLLKKDFVALSPAQDLAKIDRVLERIAQKYYRNEFSFVDNGMGEYELKTDIVFKTLDEIINFFLTILSEYKKTFRSEEINWSPIVKKFRAYL